MNRRLALAGVLGVFAACFVIACAQGNEPTPAPVAESPSLDAGSDSATLPADATPAPDSGVVELPRCSADDWCYTDLPRPESFDAGGPAANPSPVVLPLSSVWVAADHRAWSADALGRVLLWDGSRWRGVFVAPGSVRSVWGTSSTDVWLAGDFGLLHGTGDRPDSLAFTPITTPTARPIMRVWGTSASDIWILADGTNGVFHLTAATANDSSPFAPVVLPGGDAGASRILTGVWGTASNTWLAGMEYQSCAPPDCTSRSTVVAFERTAGSDEWTSMTMPVPSVTGVIGGVSTTQGQLVALQATQLNTALAARIINGTWTSELVEDYGQARSMWGQKSDDIWLVGYFGVVRHFDGSQWQVSRVTRSPYLPLVNHLNAIDAFVDPSGEQDMWIVGNDVALHRTAKP
ncbi:hypothetical protein AKJ09_01557 [Labilithrix luteola]|uniref:Type IV fimbrial biogenesis protein PilY1 n=1 Tax=Labilithrix luteola TaxID=1391654 RepID=A0A0K1PMY8_9BACT|nr:hypothetical protein [Labilithrix luteola]AKU94893.1 hypothetical protein AKJ09_01557 [Labilithrix luteola]